MSDEKTCEKCKHWGGAKDDPEWNLCSNDEAINRTCYEFLETRKDFGCNQWEPKESEE